MEKIAIFLVGFLVGMVANKVITLLKSKKSVQRTNGAGGSTSPREPQKGADDNQTI